MSEALRIKRERIQRFLNWAQAREGFTIFQVKEWFFDNYALSEISIDKTIKQLRAYGYLRQKGSYLMIGKKKRMI